jgi:Short C-terminal domain
MNDGHILPRGRRYAVRALILLGTVLAVLAIAAVFVNRQALNAENWSDTSSALLEDEAIRSQVAAFLVDEVYANVDVTAEVASALPRRLRPLAGPAANGLRTFAERTTDRTLGRPRVQEAWKQANRVTAQQFIAIAEGESKAITQSGDAVVLDLRVILLDLVQRLGLPQSLAEKVPPEAGRIQIFSADQAQTAENGVTTLRGLAVVLPFLALFLLGLAVFLARGRRRKTLLHAGFGLIIAGLVVLLARSVVGEQITSSVATTDAVLPAAEHTWAIGTRMLRDVAQATIIGAIPLVAAALLAGPSSTATAARRAMAPWLRERPGATYSVVAALFVLVIWWGPIPATRLVGPVLIMLALLILGVEVLRRQTAREFPTATVADSQAALRAHVQRARDATVNRRGRVDHLERLSMLHDRGALTDEEFAAEKAANGSLDVREPRSDPSS